MEVIYKKQFTKDVRKISDKKLKNRIQDKVNEVEAIVSAHEPADKNDIPNITNMVKLQDFEYHYRIRIGDYRLGVTIEIEIEEEENIFRFVRCLHRKDIYKKFP